MLLRHERIDTTLAKAKELRPFIERLITVAKRGLEDGADTPRALHARRLVARDLADKRVASKLFETIAPRFASRPGGYTRVLHLGRRQGDCAEIAQIEFVGSEYEKQSLLNLGKLVDEGEKYGIPVMAVTAVGRELEQRESRYLAMCCRIAAELGARVVKTYWCADGFDKVVTGCPVPVIMAGGPQADTEREVLEFVHHGMQNGAIGINLGRNIWQSDYPVAMMRALRHIVHDGATVKEAQDLYDDVRDTNAKAVSVR